MNIHKNARLTPKGREKMVRTMIDDGLNPAQAGWHIKYFYNNKVTFSLSIIGLMSFLR